MSSLIKLNCRPGERRKTWDDPSLFLDTVPDQEVEMQEAESQFQQSEAEGEKMSYYD
jgi:hypothetical protein